MCTVKTLISLEKQAAIEATPGMYNYHSYLKAEVESQARIQKFVRGGGSHNLDFKIYFFHILQRAAGVSINILSGSPLRDDGAQ